MSARIYLRALELGDYKTSIIWRKNKELWTKLVGTHYYVSEAYEQQWVEEKVLNPKSNEITLAICTHEDDRYIGNIYLTDIDWINKNAQIHIMIGDTDLRGKGLGTEAMIMMIKYVFEEKNLYRLYSQVLYNNTASNRMFEKCGFTQEGVLRNSAYKNSTYHDVYMWSLLKEEFKF